MPKSPVGMSPKNPSEAEAPKLLVCETLDPDEYCWVLVALAEVAWFWFDVTDVFIVFGE